MTVARIYARVSRDLSREGLSTDAQVADGRRIATQRGWPVTGVYIDRSVSASRYGKKPRPEYARLLADLQPGDAVLIREASRATRKLVEFTELRDRCEELGVTLVVDGRTYDMSDAEDRFLLGFSALQSEREADIVHRRITSGSESRAKSGRPHSRLPFGYRTVFTETGARTWELDPDRASLVRELADRVLAGDSLNSIRKDWNSRGIIRPGRNVTESGEWKSVHLRQLILAPSLAGLRVHRGKVVGEGVWPAILTVDEHERVKALLTDPGRIQNHRGNEPRWLLTRIARCGACGEPVMREGRNGKGLYRCPRGCIGRSQPDTDAYVTTEILRAIEAWRADTLVFDLGEQEDEHGDPIGYAPPDGSYARLRTEARELRRRLEGIKAEMIAGRIPAVDYSDAHEQLQPQVDELEDRARGELVHPLLAAMTGAPSDLWEQLEIPDRRTLAKLTVTVEILPVPVRGRWRFDPDYVRVTPLHRQDRSAIGVRLLRGVGR